MRYFIFVFFALTGFLFLSSCSSKQYQVLFDQKSGVDSSYRQAGSVNYYHIQSQDLLQIRNLQDIKFIVSESPTSTTSQGGNSTTGQTFQVEEDGTVTLPVIGHLSVAGLTRLEAQQLIEANYKDKLLVNPIIELKIVNLKVTIFGEVKAPGNYFLTKEKTTLTDIIGQAGGITERANERNIKIIRGAESNPKPIIIDLGDIRSINDPKAVLQNGDVIYVSQNKRAVRTDNLQNVSTITQPALLLFNTALIIFTLIRR